MSRIEVSMFRLMAERVAYFELPFLGFNVTAWPPFVHDLGTHQQIAAEHLGLPHWNAANDPRGNFPRPVQ